MCQNEEFGIEKSDAEPLKQRMETEEPPLDDPAEARREWAAVRSGQ